MKTFYQYGYQEDNNHIIVVHDREMIKDVLNFPHQKLNRGKLPLDGYPVNAFYVSVSNEVYAVLKEKWKPIETVVNTVDRIWSIFKAECIL